MRKTMGLVFALITMGLAANSAWAQDECDDYTARHYKQDLKPLYLVYKEPVINGVKKTFVFLVVESVGQVDVNANFNDRKFKVEVNPGWTFHAEYSYSVPSGFRRMIHLGQAPNGSFQNCSTRYVKMDTDRKAGQWGCNVFNNDSARIPVYFRAPGHIPCRIIRRPHRPFGMSGE